MKSTPFESFSTTGKWLFLALALGMVIAIASALITIIWKVFA